MDAAGAAFGNSPAKIARYRAFWAREPVNRPLIGFTQVGWFPIREFSACGAWRDAGYLTPEMIDIEAFVDDHVRLVHEGETIDDDLIRGACPGQVAIPWLPGMVGARLRILPENVLGEERRLDWDEALALRLDSANPWLKRYLEFIDALVSRAGGAFPVSHSAELGPTDLHALLRGHTQSILDLADEPEKSARLLWQMADMFREVTEDAWRRIPFFQGGYFDAQYSLWAPGPIARLQEDATAVYSPALYRRVVQPVDRMLARHFTSSFMHLHSTSMFLLDYILEIEELRCLQINLDVAGPPAGKMIPCFRKVQAAGKSLLIRGSFTPEVLREVLDSLSPRGLILLMMVRDPSEIDVLAPIAYGVR